MDKCSTCKLNESNPCYGSKCEDCYIGNRRGYTFISGGYEPPADARRRHPKGIPYKGLMKRQCDTKTRS